MAKHPHPATGKPVPGHEGKGGSRHGYRSGNEIEDMEIFDDDPGKDPSGDGGPAAKTIDRKGDRERK